LSQDERLASLDSQKSSVLAFRALHSEGNFLSRLCLLSEDRLSLTTESFLLGIVPSFTCEI
jgi:hypothetical protein